MAYIRMIIGVLIVIGVLSIMPASVQAQSDDGLVAEWHFDEGSGSVLKDSSGNGNDGVIYGATWVEGKYGKALSFDGVDDYVNCGNGASLNFGTDTFTIETWVKTIDATTDNWKGIVGKWGKWGDNYNGYWLQYFPSTGMWAFGWHGSIFLNPTRSISDGNWHHVVCKKTGSTSAELYIDGEFVGKRADLPSISTDTTDPLSVGRLSSADIYGERYFSGIIDEVRIYDRALSEEEIKSHYNGVGLIVTKTTSLHSIKQGQTTTISLDLKNSYLTEIKDIEIVDIIPSDRIQVSGETSKIFASLQPKDSIEFQYILQIDKAGTCNLDPATVTFADEKGNYYIVKSNAVTIEVIPTPTPTSTSTSTSTPTPASMLTPIPIQTSTPILTPTSMFTPTPSLPMDISPPSISILNPVIIEYNNNGLLEEGEKVEITYGSNDPSGVDSVKIILDGLMLESRNQAGTYTVITNSLPVGTHTIRVEATDSKSNYNSEELPIIVERTGPSVYFGTTRTTINKGEDAIFTLSAVNPIGNPPMTVQLILKPPSGVSVTSSSFAKAGSGIYTCTQAIESGDNVRSIEVRLNGNQAGTHEIESEVYYMFEGSSKSPTRYETLTLVVEPNPTPQPTESSPGFGLIAAFCTLSLIWYLRK